MKGNKLASCIYSLNIKEKKALKAFIDRYPVDKFIRAKSLLKQMLDQLIKKPRADWEKLQEKYQPKQFNEKQVRHLHSEMLKIVEAFIVDLEWKKEKVQRDLLLLRFYRERNLIKHFRSTSKKIDTELSKEDFPSEKSTWQAFQLFQENNKLAEQQHLRYDGSQMEKAVFALDQFYLINKLRLGNEMRNMQQVTNVNFSNPFYQQIIEQLGNSPYLENPMVAFYHLIHLTLQEPDVEKHYHQLKELLEKYAIHFEKDEMNDIYIFAFNYCVRKINGGNSDYFREVFLLYQQVLANEILFDSNGKISPWNYKNIVTTGLRLEEYEWVRDFIEEYRYRMDTKESENAYYFNLATYYFHIKEFDKVPVLLLQVSFNDIFYALDTRTLQAKIYYELQEEEPLYALLESFAQFLRRNKVISEQHRHNYSEFVKFTRQLFKLEKWENEKLSKLEKELQGPIKVADRSWLLAKLAEKG